MAGEVHLFRSRNAGHAAATAIRKKPTTPFPFRRCPRKMARIGGIVCANTDDTDRVIGARRLALLRELASRTWEADTRGRCLCPVGAGAGQRSARHAFRADLSRWKTTARTPPCAARTGIAAGHAGAPESIALDGPAPWPISDVVRGGPPRRVDRLARKIRRSAQRAMDRSAGGGAAAAADHQRRSRAARCADPGGQSLSPPRR